MKKKIAVIGAGDFGSILTTVLIESGVEVLVIDQDERRLQNVKDVATVAIHGDSTDIRFLKAQDINSFDMVVVAFGQDFESLLLTIAALQDAGVKNITARAITRVHERLIRHVGVTDVIMPIADAAERLCQRLMMTGVMDSLKLSSDYTIVETKASSELFGKNLAELKLREEYHITLVTIKRQAKTTKMGIFTQNVEAIIGVPQPDTIIQEGDILIIFGKDADIGHFIKSTADDD